MEFTLSPEAMSRTSDFGGFPKFGGYLIIWGAYDKGILAI